MESQTDCFNTLPDEMVVVIGSWLASYGAANFAQFQRTNKRMRMLLGQSQVIAGLVKDREAPASGINTLEKLGLYEMMEASGLLQENRIGFDYASTDIDDNAGEASGISQSWTRIDSVQKIMLKFSNVEVVIDAHCGTLAPRGVAPRFSQIRGMEVCGALLDFDQYGEEDESRITLNSWGRRVADAASDSLHRFSKLAREGKGWVELYMKIEDLELPQRPDFYRGLWTVG